VFCNTATCLKDEKRYQVHIYPKMHAYSSQAMTADRIRQKPWTLM